MKLFFTVLFFLPLLSFSQQKKDDKIIATVSDTTHLFDKAINLLYSEDYIVRVDDKEHGLIVTEQKQLKNDQATLVVFKFRLINNTVTVTGQTALNAEIKIFGTKSKIDFYDIYFGGMKGSTMRNAWNEMDRIAKLFGPVTYTK